MSERGNGRFPTTRWSVVLAAGDRETRLSRESLETLCEAYWYPVYVRIRRTVNNPDDARDMTQGFFCEVLQRRSLQVADPERGSFRSYLTVLLKNYMSNERRSAQTLKRGGGILPISLDFDRAESRYRLEPAHQDTPEVLFERAWACDTISRTMDRMRREQDGERFRRLEQFLTESSTGPPYSEIAAELGMTADAVKMEVYRMRRRFAALLRAEVSETVDDPALVDDEIRYLFNVLID